MIHMICGDPNLFAVECEVLDIKEKTWFFGHFRFWLHSIAIGNWNDTTSLFGCANWLQEFVDVPVNRFELGLLALPKEEGFNLLFDNVVWDGMEYKPYPQIPTRFYIDHLGMSAFDQYSILLIEDREQQRVLWRYGEDPTIYEAYLPAGEIQKVAKLFLDWFKDQADR